MASLIFLYLVFLLTTISPLLTDAESGCNDTCTTLDDCSGQLICINSKCNDDPDVGTSICKVGSAAPAPSPISDCNATCTTLDNCSGQLICINNKCNDDPDVGSNICKGGRSAPPPFTSQGNTKKSTGRIAVALFITILLVICNLLPSY